MYCSYTRRAPKKERKKEILKWKEKANACLDREKRREGEREIRKSKKYNICT